MFLIDTMVLSELRLRNRAPGVVAWIANQRPDDRDPSAGGYPWRTSTNSSMGSRPYKWDLSLRISPPATLQPSWARGGDEAAPCLG